MREDRISLVLNFPESIRAETNAQFVCIFAQIHIHLFYHSNPKFHIHFA